MRQPAHSLSLMAPLPHDRPRLVELFGGVDSRHLPEVVHDDPLHGKPLAERDSHRVGEVVLRLPVLVVDERQRTLQIGPPEGVDAGVPVARVADVGDVRFDYKDRSTPYDGELCKCPDCDKKDVCGPDGYMDISGYFKISELVEVLKLDEVAGQRVTLMLTGMLTEKDGGTAISGKDCVDVLEPCKGDFDCDADIDGGDADKMKKNFGWDKDDMTCDEKDNCAGDFDKDGDIDSTDIDDFKKVFGDGPYKDTPCGFKECKGDFDCDTDVDGQDAKKFTEEFGRSEYSNPCKDDDVCVGDFDNDKDCDGKDAAAFKKDFGRSPLLKPCKGCIAQ